MKVVFVGAGNLASSMAVAVKKAGHEVIAVFSRTKSSASLLADKLEAKAVVEIEELPRDADIYIVAVKDQVLKSVASRLRTFLSDALIVHTAGTIPMDIIEKGRRGVIYPMQTFSKQRIVDFSEVPVFVEAKYDDDTFIIKKLSESISGNVIELDSDKRKLLHLAAVFCCNFANHCQAVAEKILNDNGIPFNVMLPLVNETNAKLNILSPKQAQTGPAVRNDRNVMDAHLRLLKKLNYPQFAEIYSLLSESIQRIANIN